MPEAGLAGVTAAHPGEWTAATVGRREEWLFPLPSACLRVLQESLAAARRYGSALERVRLPAALHAVWREALAPARAELEAGRGFLLIPAPEGCPREEWPPLYWVVGLGLGTPIPQNVEGVLLYDVRDTGRRVEEGARFSVTNAESGFHTDNSFGERIADYVGLLCIQEARSGGLSQIVSGRTALRLLREERPEAPAILRRPFHVDRRGGVRPGERPTVRVPVLEERADGPLFRYLRYWIHAGHERARVPLSPEQLDALDALDAVLARPELRAEFAMRPGEMLFLNNRWLLHNRTAFEDDPDPARRRHLVRLWLAA